MRVRREGHPGTRGGSGRHTDPEQIQKTVYLRPLKTLFCYFPVVSSSLLQSPSDLPTNDLKMDEEAGTSSHRTAPAMARKLSGTAALTADTKRRRRERGGTSAAIRMISPQLAVRVWAFARWNESSDSHLKDSPPLQRSEFFLTRDTSSSATANHPPAPPASSLCACLHTNSLIVLFGGDNVFSHLA